MSQSYINTINELKKKEVNNRYKIEYFYFSVIMKALRKVKVIMQVLKENLKNHSQT